MPTKKPTAPVVFAKIPMPDLTVPPRPQPAMREIYLHEIPQYQVPIEPFFPKPKKEEPAYMALLNNVITFKPQATTVSTTSHAAKAADILSRIGGVAWSGLQKVSAGFHKLYNELGVIGLVVVAAAAGYGLYRLLSSEPTPGPTQTDMTFSSAATLEKQQDLQKAVALAGHQAMSAGASPEDLAVPLKAIHLEEGTAIALSAPPQVTDASKRWIVTGNGAPSLYRDLQSVSTSRYLDSLSSDPGTGQMIANSAALRGMDIRGE